MPKDSPPSTQDPKPALGTQRAAGSSAKKQGSTLVKWLRRVVVGVVVAFLLLSAVGRWGLSPVIRNVVATQVQEHTGCEAFVESGSISLSGVVTARSIRVRIPEVDGDEGLVLRAKELRAQVNVLSLITGKPQVESVVLDSPVFRISHDEDLNLAIEQLEPPVTPRDSAASASGESKPMLTVPALEIRSGTIELAEHSAVGQRVYVKVSIGGSLAPDATDAGRVLVDLRQTHDPVSMGPTFVDPDLLVDLGVRITGVIELGEPSLSLEATGVSLDAWNQHSAPAKVLESWERMDIDGQLESVRVSYDPIERVGLDVELARVSMTIPLPVETGTDGGPATQPLHVRRVSGQVSLDQRGLHININGYVEDLNYRINLDADGLTADAPLTCIITSEQFEIGARPELLPFAPDYVRRIFDRFSSPQGTLDTRVEIIRGRPVNGEPAPLKVNGLVSFRNGIGAFETFPYPIEQLSGNILFNEDIIDIQYISGVSPSGALLKASGTIMPPGEGAEVNVRVALDEVPIDDVLLGSLDEEYRDIVEILFSDVELQRVRTELTTLADEAAAQVPAHSAMAATGDVGDLSDRARHLIGLREKLPPTLAEGPRASIRVHVNRPVGDYSRYTNTVVVDMPGALMVPGPFPYPMVADRFELHIQDGLAQIMPTRLHGISGASGLIAGTVTLEAPFEPQISISTDNMPVDDLLVLALPDTPVDVVARAGSADVQDRGERRTARTLLREIDLRGRVSTEVEVVGPARSDSGGVGFIADVSFAEIDADPGDYELRNVNGSMRISESWFDLCGLQGWAAGAAFSGWLRTPFAMGSDDDVDQTNESNKPSARGDGILEGGLRITGLALDEPIEDLTRVIDPDVADRIERARARHIPVGLVDGELAVHEDAQVGLTYRVRVDNGRGLAMIALDDVLHVDMRQGGLELVPGSVNLDDFAAEIRYSNDAPVRFRADGVAPIEAERAELKGSAQPWDMRVQFAGLDLQGSLLNDAAAQGGAKLGFDSEGMDQLAPQGSLGAKVSLSSVIDAAGEHAIEIDADLEPENVSVHAMGGRLSFGETDGHMRLVDNTLKLDRFSAGLGYNGGYVARGVVSGELGFANDTLVADLQLKLADALVESALVRTAIAGVLKQGESKEAVIAGGEDALTDELPAWYAKLDPAGVFDAEIALRGSGQGGVESLRGMLFPKELALTKAGQRVSLSPIDGAVELTDAGGLVRQLAVQGDGFELHFDGAWSGAGEDLRVQGVADAHVASLSGDMRALLPAFAIEKIESLSLTFGDEAEVSDTNGIYLQSMNVLWDAGAGADEVQLAASGDVVYAGVGADLGVQLSDVRGQATALYERMGGPKQKAILDVRTHTDSVRVLGVPVGPIEVSVVKTSEGPEVLFPGLRGQAFGGTLVGRGVYRPGEPELEDGAAPGYEVALEFARIDFAKALEAVRAADGDAQAQAGGDVPSRGNVSGNLTVQGVPGEPQSRVGRGLLRVQGGDLLGSPALTGLVALSNLQAPSERQPDLAYAQFYVDGDVVHARDITISAFDEGGVGYASNFWIEGAGTVMLPDLAVDLSFVSRGRSDVPVVSDLLRGLRNEIITTRVTGSLYAPKLTYEQLRSTRELLGQVLGTAPQPIRATRSPSAGKEVRRGVGGVDAQQAP